VVKHLHCICSEFEAILSAITPPLSSSFTFGVNKSPRGEHLQVPYYKPLFFTESVIKRFFPEISHEPKLNNEDYYENLTSKLLFSRKVPFLVIHEGRSHKNKCVNQTYLHGLCEAVSYGSPSPPF
jgi:hypothetical protein